MHRLKNQHLERELNREEKAAVLPGRGWIGVLEERRPVIALLKEATVATHLKKAGEVLKLSKKTLLCWLSRLSQWHQCQPAHQTDRSRACRSYGCGHLPPSRIAPSIIKCPGCSALWIRAKMFPATVRVKRD
ncbi:hypothetical protein [Candidatus Methylobacter favarea]|uniref:hypothetical protein n=1 Tax=Candidatus Methylobacter favarea TaxID=2707345 RepID=UPI00157CDB62|nr:hypothetical protein [Candidatus Methylobacter favarea]